MKKLFYFTNSFPYGIGEQWKSNELEVLVNYFDEITIVPFCYSGNQEPKQIPSNIKFTQPLFNDANPKGDVGILSIIFSKHILQFLMEFFQKKVFLKKNHILIWLSTCKQILLLKKNKQLCQILTTVNSNSVLYFFWGRGTCEIIPFLHLNAKKIIIRLHGYDLYESRNLGYIPFREQLFKKVNHIIPVSENGLNYLQKKYPAFSSKFQIERLGTNDINKLSSASNDNKLRVISCSSLIPLKRVEIMIKALQYINFPIQWIHLGVGELMDNLKQLIKDLKLEDKFLLQGFIKSSEVQEFYANNTLDLFINTSSSEGVPVSIMEAFAVGIPVLATNVGGTSEIVDEKVGWLLSDEISPQELANNISIFYHLSEQEKIGLRRNAYNRFKTTCDAKYWATQLAKLISS
ncbi:MAG TPA: glycosyltransferase [Chitinophagaceae bacterium]|nr:glycosyltransferase [Chitinophagaceae bacterium]HNM33988.1 glycosyltransferase [Chitinophagaceae bacterium]